MKFKNKTIRQRQDGRWWTRYYKNGVQRSVYGKTQAECLANLKKALRNIDKPEPPKKKAEKQLTFRNWLYEWDRTYKEPYNRTNNVYRTMYLHIFPLISDDKALRDFTPLDLQQIVNAQKGRMSEEVYNVLKGSFRVALQNGLIAKDPTIALIKPKHERKQGIPLSIEEQTRFLNDIRGHEMEKLFRFYLLTGARRSEALSVSAADVNYEGGWLRIRGTKTTTSDRKIPLSQVLRKLLESITPASDGKLFDFLPDTVTHTFKRFCPTHKVHDLRHTFATRCLEQGVPMKVVQVWLGHADYKTTANIYTTVTEHLSEEYTLKIDEYYKDF